MSDKHNNSNNNVLFSVIIVLLIVIAGLAFFVGKGMGGDSNMNSNNNNNNNSITDNNSGNETGLVKEAGLLGVDTTKLKACIDSDKYEEKINNQQKTGTELFGVTGTPGNVLINNETLEYEVISGAYPTDSFVQIIDKLLVSKGGEAVIDESNEGNDNGEKIEVKDIDDKISILVIDDKRCTSCNSSALIVQLKGVPGLADASIETKDFSDSGIESFIKSNNITKLPAVIMSNNDVDAQIKTYLTELTDGSYSLNAGSTFDPFAKRSKSGFLMVEKSKLDEIKKNSYMKGNKNAKITWLEYSDLQCPFCQKLHNSSTEDDLTKKYGDDLNIIFNHFPLSFHENAMKGAKLIECAAEQKGGDVFYKLIDIAYKKKIQL